MLTNSSDCKLSGLPTIVGNYYLESYVIKEAHIGNRYTLMTLVDKDGKHQAVFWDVPEFLEEGEKDCVVHITGFLGEYRDQPQIKVSTIEKADNIGATMEDLLPIAPFDAEESYALLRSFIYGMRDETCRTLCTHVLENYAETIKTLPAAKSIHHAYIGGLLMHMVCMLRNAERVCDVYNAIPGREKLLDRDLLYCGIILHDLGKKDEFVLSSPGLVKGYSIKGSLLGHLAMGSNEVERIGILHQLDPSRLMLITHMILSHHGNPAHGAPVVPMIPEAYVLSMLDGMDAKLELLATALQGTKVGFMSEPIIALDGRRVYKHK